MSTRFSAYIKTIQRLLLTGVVLGFVSLALATGAFACNGGGGGGGGGDHGGGGGGGAESGGGSDNSGANVRRRKNVFGKRKIRRRAGNRRVFKYKKKRRRVRKKRRIRTIRKAWRPPAQRRPAWTPPPVTTPPETASRGDRTIIEDPGNLPPVTVTITQPPSVPGTPGRIDNPNAPPPVTIAQPPPVPATPSLVDNRGPLPRGTIVQPPPGGWPPGVISVRVSPPPATGNTARNRPSAGITTIANQTGGSLSEVASQLEELGRQAASVVPAGIAGYTSAIEPQFGVDDYINRTVRSGLSRGTISPTDPRVSNVLRATQRSRVTTGLSWLGTAYTLWQLGAATEQVVRTRTVTDLDAMGSTYAAVAGAGLAPLALVAAGVTLPATAAGVAIGIPVGIVGAVVGATVYAGIKAGSRAVLNNTPVGPAVRSLYGLYSAVVKHVVRFNPAHLGRFRARSTSAPA